MFESRKEKISVSVYRGTNFGYTEMETELTHRIPPSEEGWCFYKGSLAWWDGLKGYSISLMFGEPKNFSLFLGKGADYRNLSKFQLPKISDLTEISCEGHIVGSCYHLWTESEPIPLKELVVRFSIHRNWYHNYLTQHKGKILGVKPTLSLNSVEKDPQVLATLIASILG